MSVGEFSTKNCVLMHRKILAPTVGQILALPLMVMLILIAYLFYFSALEYMGCYIDVKNNRSLASFQYLRTANGYFNRQCVDICSSLNHPYAGLQYYDECWCGTTYDKNGRANDSECNTPCRDSSGIMCGGGARLSVYKSCKSIAKPEKIHCYNDPISFTYNYGS